jgi:uncharacterized Tic20 family protein
MNPLPLRVRLLASFCHLSGLTWIASSSILLQSRAVELPYQLLSLLLVLTIAVPICTWLFTRKVHDFIDRNGRESVNAVLSLLFCTACFLFTFWIVCGVYPATLGILGVIPVFMAPLILLTHVLTTFIAIIKALQGDLYNYPFIIRLIPNP